MVYALFKALLADRQDLGGLLVFQRVVALSRCARCEYLRAMINSTSELASIPWGAYKACLESLPGGPRWCALVVA